MSILDFLSPDLFVRLNILIWLLLIIIIGLKSYIFDIVVLMLIAWTQESLIGYDLIPDHLPDIVLIFVIILLLSKIFIRRTTHDNRIAMPGLVPFLAFVGICIISAILNNIEFLRVLLFIRHWVIFYLLFVALVNANLEESEIGRINKFVVFVFLLQVVVASVKWVFYDGAGETFGGENLTGTYATGGGGLHTLIPLIAVGFIVPAYVAVAENRKKYIVLFLSFIWFIIIGDKRAPFYVLPPFIVCMLYIMRGKIAVVKMKISRVVTIMALIMLALIAIARINHTLNPEQTVGGSFDLRHVFDYAMRYTTQLEFVGGRGYTAGRLASTGQAVATLMGSEIENLLLGYGPGIVLKSGVVTGTFHSSLLRFGISNGETGLIIYFLQVGVVGTIVYLWFFFSIFKRVLLVYKRSQSTYWGIVLCGTIGTLLVFFFDFLAYSGVFAKSEPLLVFLYYFVGISLLYGRKQLNQS